MHSNFNQQPDKVMTPAQFTQVVEAILEGKYSWACVLILRFAGYNPLHYIPYRTYNRLMKDHAQQSRTKIRGYDERQPVSEPAYACHHGIRDLGYLEPLDQQTNVRGGERSAILVSLSSIFKTLKA